MCSTTKLETFITDKALSPAEVALREAARDYQRLPTRGNLVGVITNGTAVLGLGNIGRAAQRRGGVGRTLAEAINGADVFLGCSAPGVLTQDPPDRSD